MHIEINYVDPKGKEREKTVMHKVPVSGQVLPFQGSISPHRLQMFQLMAPLALLHPSTMEEKHLEKISLRWLLGWHTDNKVACRPE